MNSTSSVRSIFALGLMVISLAVQAEEARRLPPPTNAIKFPKLENYRVRLECVSPKRSFKAGQPVNLTFRLKNIGRQRVIIYEWFIIEGKNLRLFYLPFEESAEKPKPEDWSCLIPELGERERRNTLEIKPGNSDLINKELPFIKAIDPKKLLTTQDFMIYGELNLNSISARSRAIKVSVNP